MQAGPGRDPAVLEPEPASGLLVPRHDLRHQIALSQPRPEGTVAEGLELEHLRQAEQDERKLDGGEGHVVLLCGPALVPGPSRRGAGCFRGSLDFTPARGRQGDRSSLTGQLYPRGRRKAAHRRRNTTKATSARPPWPRGRATNGLTSIDSSTPPRSIARLPSPTKAATTPALSRGPLPRQPALSPP